MLREQQPPAKRVRSSAPSSEASSGRSQSGKKYEILDPIGEGAYGMVYKARDLRPGGHKIVAIKRLRTDDENEGISPTALREIVLLKEFNHPNILPLIDVFHSANRYNLVLEWANRDLKKYLDDHKAFGGISTSNIRRILRQILEGIDYCHSRMVFHRDLKPQNILINNKGGVKIADFGLARAFTIPLRCYTREVVTLWYRAPELLLGSEKYSLPVDVWSVGCIFAEMCESKAIWPGESEIDQIFRIFQCLGTPNERSWPGLLKLPDFNKAFPKWPKMPYWNYFEDIDKIGETGIELLYTFFIYNPAARITARAALKHEYFNESPLSKGGSASSRSSHSSQ